MAAWVRRVAQKLFRDMPAKDVLTLGYCALGVAQFPLHVYAWNREVPTYPLVASLAAGFSCVYWPLSTPCVLTALYLRQPKSD